MSSKKKNANVSRSFLITTNPEIFSTKPRPGGYATIMEPVPQKECGEEEESKENINDKISREFRIQRTVLDSAWTLTSTDCSEETVEVPTPFQDSMDMLAVSLTTVMLMAAGSFGEITDDQYEWTYHYFSCIKDDYGHTPPNIQMILNHILAVHPPAEGEGDGKGRPQTVRTTTTVRRKSQEPEEEEAP